LIHNKRDFFMVQRVGRVFVVMMLISLAAPMARADDATEAKKGVEGFVAAWKSGDGKAIRGTLVISPQREREIGTLVDSIASIARLQKAAADKFGSSATEFFADSSAQFDARLKSIKEGPIKITGESAILTIAADETAKNKGGTIILVKSGGAWKIDAASLFNMTPERQKETAEVVAVAAKLIPITNQMTKEITEGKYAAAADAYQEFFTRYTTALKEGEGGAEKGAASGPATRK
jgi:hypothetical protein